MIKSMTGFGRGECTLNGRKFSVELKSVNHRYSEISIRLPRILNPLEERVKSHLNEKIKRGKVDVYINFETFTKEDINVILNSALCDSYVEAMLQMKERYNTSDDISLFLLTRIPDVFSVDKNRASEEIMAQMWEALSNALDIALDKFVDMRKREGSVIEADLREKADAVKAMTAKIFERAPLVAVEYSKRLRSKLEELLTDVQVDEARIIQEVTFFADKSCIDEELVRLNSHLLQFGEILGINDAAGRKLDFLIQEINREINTIGSKSNDIEITKIVVDLKSELEKIREQVQNIE